MDAIYLEGTDDCPSVILDKDKNIFKLSGKSLPENVSAFYDPIIAWLENYAKDPLKKTTFQILLDYFNTASSKLILDIFMILEEMQENGSEVEINWHYADYDEDMKEAGIEYSEMVDLKFNLILK
ncbi:MAG: DUF1987 domain-containing protein [Bacteroidales bacterium]|nr:DUF1987 domain-containing protein [Bacteroidales bacterium]MCF8391483.1 DUF1987 domain-containing protein [Bacteroidales bacterium]